MGNIKEINIKNQTYYFFDDMINIKGFESRNVRLPGQRRSNDVTQNIPIKIFQKFFGCSLRFLVGI